MSIILAEMSKLVQVAHCQSESGLTPPSPTLRGWMEDEQQETRLEERRQLLLSAVEAKHCGNVSPHLLAALHCKGEQFNVLGSSYLLWDPPSPHRSSLTKQEAKKNVSLQVLIPELTLMLQKDVHMFISRS